MTDSPAPNSDGPRTASGANQGNHPFSRSDRDGSLEMPDGELKFPVLEERHLRLPPRRISLPIFLFAATCLSTFHAGVMDWGAFVIQEQSELGARSTLHWLVFKNWPQGLVYMLAVLSILMAHEMGHFVATLIYRIPASLPYFIPFPLSPIGTMGAVIAMAGHQANRKQIFDIGIAGPLAGLVVACPMLVLGVRQLTPLETTPQGQLLFDVPWGVKLLIPYLNPALEGVSWLSVSQMNPLFMAAWVGLLVTGLNMMPISQLDGGHIVYSLFRKRGQLIARGFLLFAIILIVVRQAYMWSLMVVLVTLLGVDHPPTANDRVRLGWFRVVLGILSLSIPFLCFPARGLINY